MDERVGTKQDPIQKVRGIIFHPEGLLLMRRVRKDPKNPERKIVYYVFPGGGREMGETLEQCLHREVQEEAGVRVKIEKEFICLRFETKQEYFFICHYTDGEIGSGNGPEFTLARIKQRGLYIAEVVPLSQIPEIDLKPYKIKRKLMEAYGWGTKNS
jgi:8-oxo-dGTP pyrophosphatase MutT (NUDIX family)